MKKIIIILSLVGMLLLAGCQKDHSKVFVEKYKPEINNLLKESQNIRSQQQYMAFIKKMDSLYNAMKGELQETDSPEAKLLVAEMAFNLRKTDDAGKIYKSVLDENPDITADSVLIRASYVFLMQDSMDLARKYFEKSLESKDNAKDKDQLAVYFIDDELAKHGKEAALKLANDYKSKLGSAREVDNKIKALQLIGNPATEIKDIIKWVNTRPISLKKLRGKVVVLDFWATWCNPCRRSIPSLIELRKYIRNEMKRKDFEVFGVTKVYGTFSDGQQRIPNMEPKKEAELIKDFVKKMKMPYPVAIAKSNVNLDNYNVSGIPTFFIIDKKGIIRDMYVGFAPSTKKEMKQKVLTYLNE